MQRFQDYLELSAKLRSDGTHIITLKGKKISKEELLKLKEVHGGEKFKYEVEALAGGELNVKDLELIKNFLA